MSISSLKLRVKRDVPGVASQYQQTHCNQHIPGSLERNLVRSSANLFHTGSSRIAYHVRIEDAQPGIIEGRNRKEETGPPKSNERNQSNDE
jgi:hypothetical protein